jgi:hypothetical protein
MRKFDDVALPPTIISWHAPYDAIVRHWKQSLPALTNRQPGWAYHLRDWWNGSRGGGSTVAGRTATYDYKLQSLFKDSLEPRPFPQTTNYMAHISQHIQRRRSRVGWSQDLALYDHSIYRQLHYEGDTHPLNHSMTGSYGHVIKTHGSFSSYSACSSCRSSIRKIFLR